MVRAVMKTAVGMLVRAREPAKCRSHNWCLSFGFRAVPLPLLPAALAQRMGSPKRTMLATAKPFWLPNSWGGGQ